jgi:uncharacterized membrane protein YedE/YeeE
MLRIFLLGLVFGIALTMGEIISWFRIQEMFYFESFHMFGVIGGAMAVGMLFNLAARRFKWGTESGAPLDIHQYTTGWKRYIYGGTVFGMGWAVTGACPGPLFITLGAGYWPILVAIFGALLGTFLYGLLMKHLPH